MPARACVSAAKNSCTDCPIGVTTPIPVTTTRRTTHLRRRGCFRSHQSIDDGRQFAQGSHFGDRLLRNGEGEFVLELEKELEKTERVDAKLIDRRVRVDGIGVAAKLFGGEFFD